jgi:peptidoglycan/LPS O-acetylase OafA/YrhL
MTQAYSGNKGLVSPERAHRYSGLDGLRGIGAACVIVLHVWLFQYADDGKPGKQTADLVIGELRLVLPMFFVLSGFLLVRPWLKAAAAGTAQPSVREYLRRRAGRILPGYWVALIGALVVVWGSNNRLMPPVDHLPLFLLFAQNYDIDSLGRLDPPMWTLGVEVAFYLVLPVIGWLLVRGRVGSRMQIAIFLLFVAGGIAFNTWAEMTDAPRTLTTSLLSQAPYFAIGMVTAVLCLKRMAPAWLALAGLALVIGDAAWHINTNTRFEHWITDIPAGVGFAMIIAASPKVLDLLPFRVLGKLSYGLYLWHFPVIIWMRLNGYWPDQGLLIDVAAVAVPTTLLATASWFLIERPSIAWSHRKPAERGQVRADPVKI